MSSPSHSRGMVPPPGAWPGGTSFDDAPVSRRSIDQRPPHNQLYGVSSAAGEGSEGSRRGSQASIHNSPSSMSSSSRHLHGRGDDASLNGTTERNAVGGIGLTGVGAGSSRLPRITTSMDEEGEEGGPRSAPASGGLMRPPPNGMGAPLRSSSSPDPWTTSHSSPNGSPIDHRPNFAGPASYNAALGPPAHHGGDRRPSPTLSASSSRPSAPRHASDRGPSPQRSLGSMGDTGSAASSTIQSVSPGGDGQPLLQWPQPRTRREGGSTACGQCDQVVHGQFVRAMGKVYHLNCFRCKDCNKVVASKFFPVEEDGGRMYPLCERDYFARLDLICAKCGQALRASYITACGAKYHVEHFTCSECDTLFGPNDSYYEHDGKVFCHYHYSTRFAVKCVGCETAILKQFVEMNRNGRDECWHPECYMISKFWNVRLASKAFNTPASSAVASTVSLLEMSSITAPGAPVTSSSAVTATSPNLSFTPGPEANLSPEELKERQEAMEMKVQQIWHILSGYEESSAALIGDMLRAVQERGFLDIILLAERFILHVEVLFAIIDDIEAQFALAGAKGISHAREAKHLCRKVVNLFSTMSTISPPGSRGPSPNNSELYTLITQLAHYLKILIRIALTGSIRLDRDHGNPGAMMNCLARLNLLAIDNGDPMVKKRGEKAVENESGVSVQVQSPVLNGGEAGPSKVEVGDAGDEEQFRRSVEALTKTPKGYLRSTSGIAYGYRSLAPECTGETSLRGPQDDSFIPAEVCSHCKQAIEEDCVRLGMFHRWHSQCIACVSCGDNALQPAIDDNTDEGSSHSHTDAVVVKAASDVRRPPPKVELFWFAPEWKPGQTAPPEKIWCETHHAAGSFQGFDAVSKLEQYAFLLHIALRRLYVHYRIHINIPSARDHDMSDRAEHEVKRMKSVSLDRKLSSTARLPQRSTVVESPAGRMADENGQVVSARSTEPLSNQQLLVPAEITTPEPSRDDEPSSSKVDVIRPPFARNNTNVKIVSEAANGSADTPPERSARLPSAPPEDDMITLGDIPQMFEKDKPPTDNRTLLSQLSDLQTTICRHFALLLLQKTALGPLIDLEDMLDMLDQRKGGNWLRWFQKNGKQNKKKGTGVFGQPIEVLVEKSGVETTQLGSTSAPLKVPEFIEDIISTMRNQDMSVEGIFRKNGNIRKLQLLVEQIDKDPTTVDLSQEPAMQLAALLKRFLRELPEPLLTFRLHKLFCATAGLPQDERKRCLHLLITLLPKYNRDTMEVLFIFLDWVSTFSYKDEEIGSRMDLANLATVIAPSVLYAKGTNAARDESFNAIEAVQALLENQRQFYHMPPDLNFVLDEGLYNIFQRDMDLAPKEIYRHCLKYTQAREAALPPQHRGGIPQSMSTGQMQGTGKERDPRERPGESSRMSVLPHAPGDPAGPSSAYRPPLVPGSANHSRPTSWIQNQQSHSQQSLHQSLTSPSPTPNGPSPGWRGPGPFQGAAVNGSRTSSRGSTPSSPAPPDERERDRRSFQMDRERSWTPTHSEGQDGHGHTQAGGSRHPFAMAPQSGPPHPHYR
ncbi:hypothetical protein IAT38_003634 [Cryptococcus sp. DSM 104549]